MNGLPDGWRNACLDEIANVTLGQSPPGNTYNSDGRGAPFFQGKSEFTATFAEVRKYTAAGTKFAGKGDILISVRAPVGPTNLAPVDCCIGRGLAGLRAEAGVDQRYLMWALRATEHELASHGSGSTFPAVTGKQLKSHRINVAPLDEQRRIVDLLEDHLSRVDAAQASVRSARTRLKALRESWLSLHLGNPPSLEVHRLGDCLLESRGGWSRSQKHLVGERDGVPYLKMNNISRSGTLVLAGVVHVQANADELSRYGIRPGDVLFNSKNSGDLIGKTAVATEALDGWTFNENIMRLRFDERLEPLFVGLWFLAPRMRRQIMQAASASTNVAAVYKHHLIEMSIWIPDLARQHHLVGQSGELTEASAHLDRELSAADVRSTNLRRALLAAAFAGRLTGRTTDMEMVEEMAGV